MRFLLSASLLLLTAAALANDIPSKISAVAEEGSCSAGSEGCSTAKNQVAPGPYLAAQYHYNSGFNDKRTRWFYKVIRLAKEIKRTLVLPDFNVRVRNDTMEEHMRPFEEFFDRAALATYVPNVSQRQFRKA
jgi:hypothetical protein